jgi:Eukaryotic cytochrome b561
MIDWLLAPLSGALTHAIAAPIAWHGRLMVLAWGVCIPLGILAARYWKIAPHQNWPAQLDHKGWWHAHRFFQWLGVVLTLIALVLLYNFAPQVLNAPTATRLHSMHAALGYAVSAAALWQIAHGLLRGSKGGPTDQTLRGDHYDMTPRRRAFEIVHKSLGWSALVAAMVAIITGLVRSDAPRWMLLGIATWWIVLALMAGRWQRAGRCMDTYQAIWGPSQTHPGNHPDAPKPIGWGITPKK